MSSVFIIVAFGFRLIMLAVSKRHERRLRQAGAVEHGAVTSRLLAMAHVLFYVAGASEHFVRSGPPAAPSLVGLAIYGFGALMLIWVARVMGPLWTVKILIAPAHQLIAHPLFRIVRHPNYLLNILPELIGFAVTLHAYVTLVAGLPIYAVLLAMRIRQEERFMAERFPAY